MPGRQSQVLRAQSCGSTCRSAACLPRVVDGDADQDVARRRLGILDRNVEVSIIGERAGIEQFVFRLVQPSRGVLGDQVGVGKCRLRILVQHPHVGVGGRAIEEIVQFLDIFAVVALGVGKPEQPLFQERILAVPQRQRQAPAQPIVGEAGDAVLAPPVGSAAGVVEREVVPGVSGRGIILPHRPPLAFCQIGSPLQPGFAVGQAFALDGFQQVTRHDGSYLT